MMRTHELPNWLAMNGKTIRIASSSSRLPAALRGRRLPEWKDSVVAMGRSLCSVRNAFAHDAGRTQRKYDDQHHEGEDVLVVAAQEVSGQVADGAGAQAFDQAEQDAAQHRAVDVADAAQHCGAEGFQPGHEAHRELRGGVIG